MYTRALQALLHTKLDRLDNRPDSAECLISNNFKEAPFFECLISPDRR